MKIAEKEGKTDLGGCVHLFPVLEVLRDRRAAHARRRRLEPLEEVDVPVHRLDRQRREQSVVAAAAGGVRDCPKLRPALHLWQD